MSGRVTPKGGPVDPSGTSRPTSTRRSLRQRSPVAYAIALFVIIALIVGPLAVGIAAIFG